MAAQQTPSFDDLEPVDTNTQDDEYDSEWIELDQGEDVVGIRHTE
ncbi:hypothetical protein ACAH01_08695 [Halomicrobium sp. HM KBTZ05]